MITTRDRPALLARALGGVLAQTGGDLEVIVVSDGPSAADAAIVAEAGDPRAAHASTPSPAGCPAPARNLGIGRARGALIAFCDDDDVWEPVKLERQLAALARNPAAVLCFTGLRNIDTDGRDLGVRKAPPLSYDADPIRGYMSIPGYYIAPSSVLVRREALAAAGPFHEDYGLRGREDAEFLMRLAWKTGRPFCRVEEPLVRYRVSNAGGSLGTDPAYWSDERAEVFLSALAKGVIADRGQWRTVGANQYLIRAKNLLVAGQLDACAAALDRAAGFRWTIMGAMLRAGYLARRAASVFHRNGAAHS